MSKNNALHADKPDANTPEGCLDNLIPFIGLGFVFVAAALTSIFN